MIFLPRSDLAFFLNRYGSGGRLPYDNISTNGFCVLLTSSSWEKVCCHIFCACGTFIWLGIFDGADVISRHGTLFFWIGMDPVVVYPMLRTSFFSDTCWPCFFLSLFIYDQTDVYHKANMPFSYAYLTFTLRFTCVHLMADTFFLSI